MNLRFAKSFHAQVAVFKLVSRELNNARIYCIKYNNTAFLFYYLNVSLKFHLILLFKQPSVSNLQDTIRHAICAWLCMMSYK